MQTPRLPWIPILLLLVWSSPLWGHSATEPAPRNDAWWKERHALINQRATEAGQQAQVLFIGDSITQGWEGEGKDVWARYYAHRHAVNLGIGGDRTQHVLWRLQNGNLNGLKPRAAVVMIGTNNSNGEDNTPSQIAEGIAAIVAHLRTTLPETKILLLAIFPRSENPSAQRGKVLLVNQIIRKLADEEHVFWIDFGHQFLDEQGLITGTLMPDYLHLSPRGYALWAEGIEGRLASVIGDTPVAAAGPATNGNLSGEWIWTIRGPDGNPIAAPLILKQEGTRVSGRFARGPDRWLEIQEGKVNGNEFSWKVTRDRPDGGVMVYDMSGQLVDGTLQGKAVTQMDGNTATSDWTARRK